MITPHLSRRVLRTESPIMQVMKGLKRTENTIDLSQGIPFFGPPEDALRETLSSFSDINRYGPDAGDLQLREAIIEKVSKKYTAPNLSLQNVMVTAGANIGFLNAISAVCDPGDEVILIDPYYFNHGMTLDVLGVLHRHIPLQEKGSDLIRSIEEIIRPETRAVVIVSPNNPTGSVLEEGVVRKLTEFCFERGIWLISDETYEEFHYVGEHFSPLSIDEEAPVISLFSFSKSYGMSGWRQGYMVYPSMMYDSLLKVQDTTVICPSRIGQKLAYHCIKYHPDYTRGYIHDLNRIRKELVRWQERNRDLIISSVPSGAFYTFPTFTSFGQMGSMELAEKVLSKADVLLVPGRPFGCDKPPSLRIAYGNVELHSVKESLERMDTFLADH